MMTIAKAITSGYFPFGATMISEEMAEVFENADKGAGSIGHGYTYTGHPVGAAAGLACLEETQRLNVKDNAKARGTQLFDALSAFVDRYDIVGDVRGGRGLMVGVELVSDKETKTPLAKETIDLIFDRTYESGVMVRISGHKILISPPLILTEEDVNCMVTAIKNGLDAAS